MLGAVKNANPKSVCMLCAAPADSKDTSRVQFLGVLEEQSHSVFAVHCGFGLKNALQDLKHRARHGLRPSWGPPLRFLGYRVGYGA